MGSLLGHALGEAAADSGGSRFADATQLALYTVDGLTDALEWANDGVAADEAACLWLAYLRWLRTQGEAPPSSAPAPPDRWIDRQAVLHRRRHPDAASITALASGEMGSRQRPLQLQDTGPGALQRSAPFGLVVNVPSAVIERLTLDGAAITHGNPSAQAPAAMLAGLLHGITADGQSLRESVTAAAEHAAALETPELAGRLLALNNGSPLPSPAAGSANAADVLTAGIRLALDTADDDGSVHLQAVLAAAADETGPGAHVAGAIAGALAGALHGRESLPAAALERLEGADVVVELGGRFASAMGA